MYKCTTEHTEHYFVPDRPNTTWEASLGIRTQDQGIYEAEGLNSADIFCEQLVQLCPSVAQQKALISGTWKPRGWFSLVVSV